MVTIHHRGMTPARPRSGRRGQMFMITGIGVHDRTDWPFTITGMRNGSRQSSDGTIRPAPRPRRSFC